MFGSISHIEGACIVTCGNNAWVVHAPRKQQKGLQNTGFQGVEIRKHKFDSCVSGVFRQYLVLENKDVLKYNGHTKDFQAYAKALKTPTAITSDEKEDSEIYIADRAGCVYSVPPSGSTQPHLLFGSISMLTGISLTEKYIVTADKDSKIRIAHRSNPRYIEDFVMVHSRPLTSTAVVLDRYVVSGGYDEYVSIYDTLDRVAAIYDLKSGTTVRYDPNTSNLPGAKNQRKIRNATQGNPESPGVQTIAGSRNWALVLSRGKGVLLEISSDQKGEITGKKEGNISFCIRPRTVNYPQQILDASGAEKPEEPRFVFISDTGHLCLLVLSREGTGPEIAELAVLPGYKRNTGLSLIAQGKVIEMYPSIHDGEDSVSNADDDSTDTATDDISDDS